MSSKHPCPNSEPHDRHEWLEGVTRRDCPGLASASQPAYFNRQWHYPESWDPVDILYHALTFALRDYEAMSGLAPHPFTQGPQALRNALETLQKWAGA